MKTYSEKIAEKAQQIDPIKRLEDRHNNDKRIILDIIDKFRVEFRNEQKRINLINQRFDEIDKSIELMRRLQRLARPLLSLLHRLKP